jgi:ApaG protein
MDPLDTQKQGDITPGQYIYSHLTNDVKVEVKPEYLPEHSKPEEEEYIWLYQIKISNLGSRRLQVLSRRWLVTDGFGNVDEVSGPGVVGEQPTLLPDASYSYNSGCPLSTPTGNMRGWYELMDLDSEEIFEVVVPLFFLRTDLH